MAVWRLVCHQRSPPRVDRVADHVNRDQVEARIVVNGEGCELDTGFRVMDKLGGVAGGEALKNGGQNLVQVAAGDVGIRHSRAFVNCIRKWGETAKKREGRGHLQLASLVTKSPWDSVSMRNIPQDLEGRSPNRGLSEEDVPSAEEDGGHRDEGITVACMVDFFLWRVLRKSLKEFDLLRGRFLLSDLADLAVVMMGKIRNVSTRILYHAGASKVKVDRTSAQHRVGQKALSEFVRSEELRCFSCSPDRFYTRRTKRLASLTT